MVFCVKVENNVILRYVLRRDLVIFEKNVNFELEICVKPRGGRAARCMGTPPVAEMLASETRHVSASGLREAPAHSVYEHPSLLLFPRPRIERVLRDFATPSNKVGP